jgi:L-fuconolactonase
MIDAHQHFWRLGEPGHSWPNADWPAVHRDWEPADLAAATHGLPLAGTVLVQSQPTDHDTDWMLALGAETPLVKAVVGWVDLASPEAPARIGQLARQPLLRGLRPMLQAIEDTDWLLRPDLAPAIEAMIAHGLSFDALVQPRHLPMLARFADRWPALSIVIDHGAKPAVGREFDGWAAGMAALAARGLHAKLSGLRTEQAPGEAASALKPYVDHLVSQFGQRLMWGSDWPVLALAGDSYADWYAQAQAMVRLEDEAERARLFGGCAKAFYRITDTDEALEGRS